MALCLGGVEQKVYDSVDMILSRCLEWRQGGLWNTMCLIDGTWAGRKSIKPTDILDIGCSIFTTHLASPALARSFYSICQPNLDF